MSTEQAASPKPAKQLERLMDLLDGREDEKMRARRTSQRIVFRRSNVLVRVLHPGGSTSQRVVATRNLSSNGLSVLYPGFIHTGTAIELMLPRRQGGTDPVRGVVKHCAFVAGQLHDVGVQLTQKIYPRLYIDPDCWCDLAVDLPADPGSIHGSVLHVDDEAIDRALVRHHLRLTQVELVDVGTAAEAVEQVKARSFQAALVDLNIGIGDGVKLIGALREAGYTGPIAVLTAETSPDRLHAAEQAGVAAVIKKPFESSHLIGLLAQWLDPNSAAPSDAEAIASTLAADRTMLTLITQFVERCRGFAQELAQSDNEEHLERVRNVCMTIKGSGRSFGFSQLSDAGADAVKSLDATQSVEESHVQVQKLIDLCHRVVPSQGKD